jgi:ABC-type uncharacterized transport system permease subunit
MLEAILFAVPGGLLLAALAYPYGLLATMLAYVCGGALFALLPGLLRSRIKDRSVSRIKFRPRIKGWSTWL